MDPNEDRFSYFKYLWSYFWPTPKSESQNEDTTRPNSNTKDQGVGTNESKLLYNENENTNKTKAKNAASTLHGIPRKSNSDSTHLENRKETELPIQQTQSLPFRKVSNKVDPSLQSVVDTHKSVLFITESNPKHLTIPKMSMQIPNYLVMKESSIWKGMRDLKGKKGDLLEPRHRKTMMKLLPVDDSEIIDDNMDLRSWRTEMQRPSDSKFRQIPEEVDNNSRKSLNNEEEDLDTRGELEGFITRTDDLVEEYFKEDLFADVEAYKNDALYAPYGFFVMCCFQIIWGIFLITQSVLLLYVKIEAVEFFSLEKPFAQRPIYLLMAASVLSIIIGVLGFFTLSKDIPVIFKIISNIQWVICSLCTGSYICAYGGWPNPTISTYYRLMEAVVLNNNRVDPDYLLEVFPGVKSNVFDRMQTAIRCCGIVDATDWVKISVPKVPDSCCIDKQVCPKKLEAWSQKTNDSNGSFIDNFDEIRILLYPDTCMEAIQIERENHIRDWTSYPAIYFAFYLALMMSLNYLLHLIEREYYSFEGISRMYTFRVTHTDVYKARLKHVFWTFLPCFHQHKVIPKSSKIQVKKSKRHLKEAVSVPHRIRHHHHHDHKVAATKRRDDFRVQVYKNEAEDLPTPSESNLDIRDAKMNLFEPLAEPNHQLKPQQWVYKKTEHDVQK